MITVELPALLPYQREVLNFYLNIPRELWCVIKSPRLVGKSILLECLLIAASFNKAKSHSISISPIASLARKLFNDVVSMASPVIRKQNAALLDITFINDSTINFYSAESGDNLRGDTVKRDGILCVDEAAYIKENFFYEIAVPFTNVTKADIFIFSTPKFKQGLFYDLYTKGVNGYSGITSFDWTKYDLSKFLDEKTLDMYRKRLPKNAFRSEYLAEFIDGDGAVFTDFKQCVGNYELDMSSEVFLSVDWGTGQGMDDTVITIGQYSEKLNKACIYKQVAFNNLGTNATVEQILFIIKDLVLKGCKNIRIVVEKNSIGNVFFSVMKEKIDEFLEKYNSDVNWKDEINISQGLFNTSNKTKGEIILKLIVCFELNTIILPDYEKLLNQLAMFECTVNSKGVVYYGAASGFHDDCVMSLAIMVNYLFNEILK